MRLVVGLMSLLIVLLVVGVLAKKQLGAASAVPIRMDQPALALPLTSDATPHAQSQQIQQQIKQSVEAAMQQRRPQADDLP